MSDLRSRLEDIDNMKRQHADAIWLLDGIRDELIYRDEQLIKARAALSYIAWEAQGYMRPHVLHQDGLRKIRDEAFRQIGLSIDCQIGLIHGPDPRTKGEAT